MKKSQTPYAARIPYEDTARRAIAEALDQRPDLELSWLSRTVLGRNHAYLFQFLVKGTPRVLDYGDAVKIARFLNLDITVFEPDAPTLARMADHGATATFKPAPTYADTIPIYGAAAQLPQAVGLGNQPIGHTPRHPAQADMKDAFAFYAVDDSMAPRYRLGELVYGVANKPPARGQDCLVELHSGMGFLREFSARTGDSLLCRQLAPARDWEQPAQEVKALHAIVGRG